MNTKSRLEMVIRLFFIALILVSTTKVSYWTYESFTAIRNFWVAKGDYNHLRDLDPIFASSMEARRILPNDASIEVLLSQGRARARYVLFPKAHVSKNGSYIIDFEGLIKELPPLWKKYQLSTGVMVYAKPGFEFIEDQPPAGEPIRVIIVFLAVALANLLTGIAVLALLNIPPQQGGIVWHLGSSYLIGFILLGMELWFFLLLDVTLEAKMIIILWGITLTILLLLGRKAIWKNYSRISPGKLIASLPKNPLGIGVAILSCFLLAAILTQTVLTPVTSRGLGGGDALNNWILKSKMFFHYKQLIFDNTYYNQYPILWPLNVAAQFSLSGGCYDEIAKWTVALLFLAFISQLVGAMSFLKVKSEWAWVSICLFLACFTNRTIASAYAETAFLALIGAALAAVLGYIRFPSERGFLILGIITAAGLSAVKYEGGIAAVFIGIALAAQYPKPLFSKKAWVVTIGFALPAVVIGIGWFAWVKSAGYLPGVKDTHLYSGLSLDKFAVLIKALLRDAYKSGPYNGIIAGIALSLLLYYRKAWNKAEIFLSIVSIALILFTGMAITGWNIERITLSFTATDRLFLHATPALILLLASVMSGEKREGID